MKLSRLTSIDTLRGFAALFVAVYHLFEPIVNINLLSPDNLTIDSFWKIPLSFGFLGVYLFFVISGFCIHLRWVKALTNNKDTKINFREFWWRRIIRLYPAYLVALFLYIGVLLNLGLIEVNSFFVWDVISHLFMTHNFDLRTVYSFNNVFWTLAVEEQLYLAYFAMLWMRQKLGWKWTLLIAFAMRFVWFAVCYLTAKTGFIIPFGESAMSLWFIWILGALAVEEYYGLIKLPKWTQNYALGIFLILLGSYLYYSNVHIEAVKQLRVASLIIQPLWGIGFFIILNRFVKAENFLNGKGKLALIGQLLAFIGLFSYSLYLIHEIVFSNISSMWIIELFIALICSYLFYLLFEKPFTQKKTI